MNQTPKQTHSGTGDNVIGGQTKIGQQVNLGDGSRYIGKQIINDQEPIPPLLTTPPFIPDIFEGREEDLQAVHDKLFAGEQLLLLVNGEGGIGKTTLAAKYWQRYADEYQHRAWVFAQSSLADALLTLAQPLRVEFSETMLTTEQMLAQLLAAMGNLDEPCLLVIDNANDIQDLEQHYPALRTCRKFRILLTTRITTFEHAETYHIKPLDEADALALFKKHYPRHLATEDNLFKSIHTAIGGNTLVLELLAKNLAAINTDEIFYSLAELLQDLQKKGLLQLSQTDKVSLAGKDGLTLKKENPVDVIGALYNELEMVVPLDEDEQTLLSNLAVLPAENLPYIMLKTLLDPPDAKVFSNRLTRLAKRGWIEKGQLDNATFYKISPVVQEIIRHKNKLHLLSYCTILITTLIDKLDYQSGVGHFINVSYQDAAIYSRYAEAATACFHEADDSLAILYECIGNYHKTTGNLVQALVYFEDYNRLEKELNDATPDNVDFKNGLAISYERLGTTHTTLGNLDQVLGFYEDYNRLEKELYDATPDNVKFKNGLAISYSKLGNIHTTLGNLDQALGFYEDFNRLEKELNDATPDNVEFKNGLAISYSKLGDIHTTLGNLDQALGFYEDFNRLEKELNDATPDNVDFKNGLAISYERLGTTHTTLGNLDQVLGFYEDYKRLEKELYDAYPDNVEFKNGLAISCQNLGNTHTTLGNLDQALGFYEDTNRLKKGLYDDYPDNVQFKNGLAISCQNLGTIHTTLGNLDQALGFYEDTNRLSKELYDDYPDNVDFKNGLAISYQNLGDIHTTLGNLDQALGFYEDTNRLSKELYDDYPDNVDFKNGLALSLQGLGWIHEKLEKPKQAGEFYKQSRQLLEQMAKQFPQYVEFKNNLEWVNNRLAEI